MTVQALTSFTYKDNILSMYAGEVADVDDTIGAELIAEGYVKEYSEGGGSDGGYDIVIHCDTTFTEAGNTLSHYSLTKGSYSELYDKFVSGAPLNGVIYYSYDYDGVGHNTTYYAVPLTKVEWYSNNVLTLVFTKVNAYGTEAMTIYFDSFDVTISADGINSISHVSNRKNIQ